MVQLLGLLLEILFASLPAFILTWLLLRLLSAFDAIKGMREPILAVFALLGDPVLFVALIALISQDEGMVFGMGLIGGIGIIGGIIGSTIALLVHQRTKDINGSCPSVEPPRVASIFSF